MDKNGGSGGTTLRVAAGPHQPVDVVIVLAVGPAALGKGQHGAFGRYHQNWDAETAVAAIALEEGGLEAFRREWGGDGNEKEQKMAHAEACCRHFPALSIPKA